MGTNRDAAGAEKPSVVTRTSRRNVTLGYINDWNACDSGYKRNAMTTTYKYLVCCSLVRHKNCVAPVRLVRQRRYLWKVSTSNPKRYMLELHSLGAPEPNRRVPKGAGMSYGIIILPAPFVSSLLSGVKEPQPSTRKRYDQKLFSCGTQGPVVGMHAVVYSLL